MTPTHALIFIWRLTCGPTPFLHWQYDRNPLLNIECRLIRKYTTILMSNRNHGEFTSLYAISSLLKSQALPVTVTATSIIPAKKGLLYSLLKPLSKMGCKRSNVAHAPELLLHSNLPPSDSERAVVCDVVAAVEEEIVQLQQKPPKFSPRRRRRLSQCTELLRVHNAVLSPIRWVPPEVLEEIFRHCTWPDILDQNCHWRELPWAISQVCRTWRDITLNLPCLWNRTPIHLGDNTLANLDAQASFLTGLLARSRNAPLYLHVQAPFKEYDWHPLINALAPHSERVEELTIKSSAVTMNAFRKFKGRLPLLRKLTLSKTSQRNHPSALIIDLFEEAPLLREVTLFALYTHELILPWPQVISFNGSRINRTGLSQLVANSLDLERLEIAGYSYGAGPRTATLRHLTTLKVKLENPTITSNFFFGSLNLPKVEEIEVEEYQGDLLPHLIAMLLRCPTPSMLRKLTLRNIIQEAPGDLTSLLWLAPQLQELDLELPPISDLFELIITPEKPPLVPMLETLIIHIKTEDIWRKEIPATAIARSRLGCDMMIIDEKKLITTAGSFPPPPPPVTVENRRKLKTFRLIFSNPNSRHMAQAELNRWLEGDDDSDSSKPSTASSYHHLKSWRHVLHEELPELDHKSFPLIKKFDLKLGHRLDRLLGAIEEFQLDDVKSLYVRNIKYIFIFIYLWFIPTYYKSIFL